MWEKIYDFGEKCITQNSFHKYNQPIIINEVDIKIKCCYLVKNHMVIKVHFNTLLDT